ncbi:AAA family ATPase [Microbacterium sp. A93]|uniref:AAA family ATPase n=1 Tax=Microbacterium sp. A93 TaxID=3450716 RepID=UPI003F42FF5E
MRIHRIELNGFGPFAGRETVDFTTLNEAGLFLLDGPTGAGKSTVLAGICFALYGTVPGGRSPESLASTQSPVGTRPEVLLDFTIRSRRFEVLRWPRFRRVAKRQRKEHDGVSLTEEKAGAVLREQRDGQWVELSVRADEIGQLLRAELSLDAQQFMRVVLLPQGEFAHFLRADSKEKETLLRTLFGTGRFDGVEASLADRLKAVGQSVQRDRDQVEAARQDLRFAVQETLGEQWWRPAVGAAEDCETGRETDSTTDSRTDSRTGSTVAGDGNGTCGEEPPPEAWPDAELVQRTLAAVVAAVDAGAVERQQAAAALQGAQEAVEQLTRRQQDLRAAEGWQSRSTLHEQRREQAAADRVAVERHREAVPLQRRAVESAAAQEAFTESRQSVEQAVEYALSHPLCAQWDRLGATGDTPEQATATAAVPTPEPAEASAAGVLGASATGVFAARFDGLRQRAERDLDRLADREEDAAALVVAETDLARLQADISRWTLQVRTEEDERLRLAGVHRGLQQRVEDLTAPAAGLEAAQQGRDRATARWEAAVAHDRDGRLLAEAEDLLRAATDGAQAAVDAWQRVVEQRLAGAASLLAGELESGSPCQVCGSVEHPAPAAPGGAEISAEAQESARQEMEVHSGRRRQAEEAVSTARSTAEASRVGSGGLTPEAAEQASNQARDEVATARKATEDLALTRSAVTQNEQDQQDRAAAAQTARGELAGAQARLTTTEQTVQRLRQAVVRALGEHDDLASVRRELEEAKARVEAVQAAVHQEVTRRTVAAQAREQLADDLAASSFTSVDQLRAALLPGDQEDQRGTALRDWDREEAALTELAASEAVVRGRALIERGTTPPSEAELAARAEAVQDAARRRDTAAEVSGALESLHRLVTRQTGVLTEVAERSASQLAVYEETESLLRLVRGAGENSYKMTLGSYVLAGRLEEVVAAATERLLGMTQGRYELRHDDSARGRGVRGLDITVLDRFTEDERAAATLSGGETFMASLALALGLADTVQAEAGGIDMDTLFVDEGFGSLDSETLADVMDVLDGLQAGGRTIGIVSHVERMKQDIGYRLEVQKTKQGSHLQVRVPDPA